MRGKTTHTRRRTAATVIVLCLLAAACSGAKDDEAASSVDANGGIAPGDTTLDGALEEGEPVDSDGDGVVDAPSAPDPAVGSQSTGGATGGSGTGGATGGDGGGGGGGEPTAAAPEADLFSGAANTHGLSDTEIRLCAHAALSFGPAFNATADDFNVYYSAVNDAGGVHGRKITATYENDNYDPGTAVQAAEACKAKKPYAILGGIGFDQIPAVRNWAEANKELYFHHIATVRGSEGKRYSFTSQPTVERVGQAFGQLAAARFKDKKIGVLYRNSEFWQPGFDAFKAVAKERGLNVVLAVPVEKNQANYTQALVSLKNAGAEAVFGWENTLALTQMVKQAKAQNYSPMWLAFPFNLTSQTLDEEAMTPPMLGLSTWPGYSKGDYGGTFAPYAADMKEFERQYAKYRPNTDIGGVAGDLLWLNWVEQKRIVEILRACGRDCTRNRLVGMLEAGYRTQVSPTCPLDFSRGHDGSGGYVNVLETYRSPSGKVNWKTVSLCHQSF